jgi:hypothetical protein
MQHEIHVQAPGLSGMISGLRFGQQLQNQNGLYTQKKI